MTEPAIRVQNLSKRYRIGAAEEKHETLAAALAHNLRRPLHNLRRLRDLTRFSANGHEPDDTIWALKDVSFEVQPGEVVGIIGRNGAGKSTLLKILSRITHPTSGRVELNGRVSSLLEVGTGFHPELTGRENVYLNGTILGMRKVEIDRKFDEIVDFSGVAKFIDTPVKRYSSGMKVRLAFSVAAHLVSEILLIDEVLAVGDIAFQQKCLQKMDDVSHSGRTILFVSHNLAAIQALCSRSVLIDSGRVVEDSKSNWVIERFKELVTVTEKPPLSLRKDRRGDGQLMFTSFSAKSIVDGSLASDVVTGHDLQLEIDYTSKGSEALTGVHIAIGVYGQYDEKLFHLATDISGHDFEHIPGQGRLICHIPRLRLQPGTYSINLYTRVNNQLSDWIIDAGKIEVLPGRFFASGRLPSPQSGPFLVDHSWSVQTKRTFDEISTR